MKNRLNLNAKENIHDKQYLNKDDVDDYYTYDIIILVAGLSFNLEDICSYNFEALQFQVYKY